MSVARRFQVLIEYDPADRAWVTYVPSLDNLSLRDSREDALANTREAILGYLEAAARKASPSRLSTPRPSSSTWKSRSLEWEGRGEALEKAAIN